MRLWWLLGLRQIYERPFRYVLTALGIAAGVALLVAIRLVSVSAAESFRDNTEAMMGSAKLSVRGAKTGFPESLLEKVEAAEGVRFAVPVVESQTFFTTEDGDLALMVLGLDLLKEGSARAYRTSQGDDLLADPLVFLNQIDSIIITETFAKEQALELNDSFTLNTALGPTRFVVRGILRPEGGARAFGGSLAIMDIDGARYSFGKRDKVDRIDIIPTVEADVAALQDSLQLALGPAYVVEAPEGQVQALVQMTQAFSSLLDLMAVFALIVSLFLVYNTTSISLAERLPEIATLISVGMPRIGAVRMILFENLLFGLIASLIGCVFGLILGQSMVEWASQSMSAQFLTPIRLGELPIDVPTLVISTGVGVGITFLATLIPAWRTSRIEPIRVLKNTLQIEDAERGRLSQMITLGPALFALFVVLALSKQRGFVIGALPLEVLLFVASLVLMTPWVFRKVLQLLRRALVSVPGSGLWILAVDGVLKSGTATWINIISLTVSFSMVANIGIVQGSFHTSILGWFERVFSADLSVAQGLNIVGAKVQPFSEDLLPILANVPGVRRDGAGIAPGAVYGMQLNNIRYQGANVKVKAFDRPGEFSGYRIFDLQNARSEVIGPQLFEGRSAFVTDNFVARFGVGTGQDLVLDTPTGPATFRVRGIVTDYVSPVGTVYLSREVYRSLWSDTLVAIAFVHGEPGISSEVLKSQVDRQMGAQGLIGARNVEIIDQGRAVLRDSFAPLRSIEFVALLVALLGLINTLFIRALQRVREFGILQAVGLSRWQLAQLLTIEALLQTFLTCVVALAISAMFAQIWLIDTISSILGWMILPTIPFGNLAFLVGIALAIGLMAVLFPIARLKRMTIKEAIHHD